MTLLLIHILASGLALTGGVWLLAAAWLTQRIPKQSRLKVSYALTATSLLTGGVLAYSGASVTRVCIEGGLVLGVSLTLFVYSKRLVSRQLTA